MSGDGAIANEMGEQHKANTKAIIMGKPFSHYNFSAFSRLPIGIEGKRFWCIYTRYIGIAAPLLFNENITSVRRRVNIN